MRQSPGGNNRYQTFTYMYSALKVHSRDLCSAIALNTPRRNMHQLFFSAPGWHHHRHKATGNVQVEIQHVFIIDQRWKTTQFTQDYLIHKRPLQTVMWHHRTVNHTLWIYFSSCKLGKVRTVEYFCCSNMESDNQPHQQCYISSRLSTSDSYSPTFYHMATGKKKQMTRFIFIYTQDKKKIFKIHSKLNSPLTKKSTEFINFVL